MRQKILTVDDSKTVRLIIKKAFSPFDCEISEAGNGVEGLAVAAKVQPDLVLLDLTMPVMDGVEMLTRLKADPALKGIPVIMLTAEGGRDNVLTMAKLGVKGYIVKPFKEDAMIQKVGQIIELKPVAEGPTKQRTALDPVNILVVEDKPAIVQQIAQGLKQTGWGIKAAASQGEAIDACTQTAPDVIIVSLSLPDDSAYLLFRNLRASPKTRATPVFAMFVKTDAASQARAQELGFSGTLTKPIDPAEMEAKLTRALNLDTSLFYFRTDGEVLVFSLPASCSASVLEDVARYLGPKLSEAVSAGISRVVLDLKAIRSLPIGIIKLTVETEKSCHDLGMHLAIVGNPEVAAESKAFVETRSWVLHETLEAAKAQLGIHAPAAQLAGA